MEEFEKMLQPWRGALERFVFFRIPIRADAEDVLQDIYLTAFKNFESLRQKEAFRGWIFSIARNKCKDYFAMLSKRMEIPLDMQEENMLHAGVYLHQSGRGSTKLLSEGADVAGGVSKGPETKYEDSLIAESVRAVLEKLKDKDKQILYLYFFRELPQIDISKLLGIPIGTVKSRLHSAKEKFKDIYMESGNYQRENVNIITGKNIMSKEKERCVMKKFPEIMPEYRIESKDKSPFEVRWEELLGWFLIPRLGEKSSFAIYDRPEGKCTWVHSQKVTGEAEVHGISGVEIACYSWSYEDYLGKWEEQEPERILVAQLTDTHCRYLASTEKKNGVKKYRTFLDGEEFTGDWGFGEDNCGKEVNIRPKGDVTRNGNEIIFADKKYLLDVVGRYAVTINGKTYDTICVMDVEVNVNGTVTEQFIDENGRTVLWRIYCQDNWQFPTYNKLWTEMLPDSQRLTVNGLTYVHLYDCITDYVL